jgi:hypothetical protein
MSHTDKSLYFKLFSSLKLGAPIFHPCPVQLGDVGFIDAQDGYFQKLYNVADPPKNVAGCPDPLKLVKCEPLFEKWEAVHVSTTHPLSLSSSDSCVPSQLKNTRGRGVSARVNVLVEFYLFI